MKLRTALGLGTGEIVAFVGGGGKTTAMFRLAQELVAEGQQVITTTTTRLGASQVALAPAHLRLETDGLSTRQRVRLLAELDAHRHVLVVAMVDNALDKAVGVDPELIPILAQLPGVNAVLVEADGAREKPFKAPAAYEPMIPSATTVVVPVMGVEALGQPLTTVWAHRVELICGLTGASEGDLITPKLAAQVLAHPQGGRKNVPPGARVIPLINKVESEAQADLATATAVQLLQAPGCEAVMIGTMQSGDPVRRVLGRVSALVLAAGRSTRMGAPKHILPWGEGETIISQVVKQLRLAGVSEIVVVTGGAREAVEGALAAIRAKADWPRELELRAVYNPDYASKEMLSSLQVGLRALSAETAAVLVALGDQPQMEAAVARAVMERWRETRAPVVGPTFQGRRGHPVLFDRSQWPALLSLPDTASPRDVLSGVRAETVAVERDTILQDVDTQADYERARANLR
jgi:molybdenum cofactor cytidylyltransferase